MRRTLTLLLATLVASTSAFADATQSNSGFYNERERGWFWHEPEYEEKEKETEDLPVPVPAGPADSKNDSEGYVDLDIEWLKENIEVLKLKAIETPSTENLAAYAYAQRLMLDMSSRFSRAMMDFMAMEGELDESTRRPTSTLSLNVFKAETARALSETISALNDSSHLWFFYASDCPYCMQQLPIIKEFGRRYGLEILAISMDGGILPGTEQMETVIDTDLRVTNMFNLQYTPSIVLASSIEEADNADFTIISEGLITLDRLERTTLLAARDMNLITAEQYAMTTEVREINVLTDESGVLQADKRLLDEDPGYLAEILKAKLRGVSPVGATSVGGE